MSVKEKLTAIADEIRKYTIETDKLSLDEMPTKISRVHDIGFENGVQKGIIDGYQEGYTEGKVEAETTASTEKNNLSLSLSEALTSGDNNVNPLEDNINQAKSDIGAIKTFIENYGKEVPAGTLSSTYPTMLDEVVIAEKDASYMQGYGTGMEAGTEEGYQTGYTEGETAGIATGKEVEKKRFWQNYQNYGNRTLWQYAFYDYNWDDDIYAPIYDIKATNVNCMYTSSYITNTKVAINITASGDAYRMFYNCTKLHTIPKLGVVEGLTYGQTFYNCTALKNIVIEGVIGNTFDIHWSPLTKASIENVINALSTTGTSKTLSLKKTAVETAFPYIFAATFSNETPILDVIGTENLDYVVWAMGIGDYAEIGEYVYISFADTNVILQKTGDSVQEASGINEGQWSLIAYGNDIKDEWGDLVSSKPNWTISLV